MGSAPDCTAACVAGSSCRLGRCVRVWEREDVMSAARTSHERQHVLVRHVVATKRKDVYDIESLLRAPFDSGGSAYSDGGPLDVSILGYPTGRWLIAARFAGQRWVALYSNAASPAELFQAHASSRRLEVAWLGF